jgi:hypothetical protein
MSKANTGPKGARLMTPKVCKAIKAALEKGNTQQTAATLAGISLDSLMRWKRLGYRDLENGIESAYSNFYTMVERAREAAVDRYVQIIHDAASEDWRAAAFFLERRHPKHWGKTEKHQHSGPEGGPMQIQAQAIQVQALMRDEEAAEALALLAEKSAALQLQNKTPQENTDHDE